MPKRFTTEEVRARFTSAGLIPDNNFQYKNNKQRYRVFDILNNKYTNMSLQTLEYNIKKGHRPLWEEIPLPDTPTAGTPAAETPAAPARTGLERFINKHQGTFQELPAEIQQDTYNTYQQLRSKIMRQQEFVYTFSPEDFQQTSQMRATIMALNDSLAKILSRGNNIRLKITTASGHERYFHINPTTLADLWAIFRDVEPDFSVEDSAGNFALDTLNISNITFSFPKQAQGRQVAAGFFPFINTTPVDLSRYGIYNSPVDPRIAEPCILTAFRNSNIMTQEELAELQEMIKTREFPQTYLQNIAEHFNLKIYVRIYRNTAFASKADTSHKEFDSGKSGARELKLMIFYNHYMIYEVKPSNYSLIKSMIVKNELVPFTDKQLEQTFQQILDYSPQQSTYNTSRPVVIHAPKPFRPGFTGTVSYGKHLFGYEPLPEEIDFRLAELQDFINSLQLRHAIDVRQYFKFSNLMLRIMYEYGCFDNVYEFAGTTRDSIRNSLTFPSRELTTNEINEKCYYLDFNGAYTSFMTHIPAGVDFQERNTKIYDLINIMYTKRLEAKESGNKKLATTIKFLMNSCYGASIAKAKTIKHKFSENIAGTINNQGNLVIAHEDKSAGFVNILQPYVEHYNWSQFAKVILDGFNNKMAEIKSIVKVLFQNIDAIIVNESDYNKLQELGYIHPTELGKLKVEHIFSSVKFYSKMRWVAVNEDGTEFRHCM